MHSKETSRIESERQGGSLGVFVLDIVSFCSRHLTSPNNITKLRKGTR